MLSRPDAVDAITRLREDAARRLGGAVYLLRSESPMRALSEDLDLVRDVGTIAVCDAALLDLERSSVLDVARSCRAAGLSGELWPHTGGQAPATRALVALALQAAITGARTSVYLLLTEESHP
jgi:hypothetical protein